MKNEFLSLILVMIVLHLSTVGFIYFMWTDIRKRMMEHSKYSGTGIPE